MFELNDYRQILKEELEKRSQKNPYYSLRAFSRDLQISSARLSEIFNSKSGLSSERAQKIAALLGYTKEETDYFQNLVESVHARSQIKKQLAKARLIKFKKTTYQQMDLDHFKIISEWYHLAILSLIEINNFKSNTRWMAQALGIQEIEASLALERLVRLGYIYKKNKKYCKKNEFLAASSLVPSEAIRKFHRQILQKAQNSIDLQKMDQRELGAMIMTIDRSDLPKFKEQIRQVRKELNKQASVSTVKNAVYVFSTQLFELTQSHLGIKK